MGRASNTHRGEEKYIKNSGGKPEEKRPLGILRCSWEGNIKMEVTEMGWGSMDWIHLAQGIHQWRALVKAVMNLRVP
jgi:hypothetical protein